MIKYIIPLLFLAGCENNTIWGDIPFIESEKNKLLLGEHTALCKKRPTSIFCKNSISVGDIIPTREYALNVLKEMNLNFKYKENDSWIYNNTVYEYLKGDCEDIASTMAKHMIDDGIGKEYLYLVYRLTGEKTAHMFLAVDTLDAGLLHLDYSNSGYKIEPKINFYLPMTNVGIYSWIKGNIK